MKLQQMFSFKGRASRGRYWLISLLSLFISLIIILFSLLAIPTIFYMSIFSPTVASIVSILLYVLLIPLWIISLATTVRRFHDRNKSGWWILLSLIPIIGGLWILIECGCLKGTTGANRFGEDPLIIITVPQPLTGQLS